MQFGMVRTRRHDRVWRREECGGGNCSRIARKRRNDEVMGWSNGEDSFVKAVVKQDCCEYDEETRV